MLKFSLPVLFATTVLALASTTVQADPDQAEPQPAVAIGVPLVEQASDSELEIVELEPASDALSEQEAAAWRAHNRGQVPGAEQPAPPQAAPKR